MAAVILFNAGRFYIEFVTDLFDRDYNHDVAEEFIFPFFPRR